MMAFILDQATESHKSLSAERLICAFSACRMMSLPGNKAASTSGSSLNPHLSPISAFSLGRSFQRHTGSHKALYQLSDARGRNRGERNADEPVIE